MIQLSKEHIFCFRGSFTTCTHWNYCPKNFVFFYSFGILNWNCCSTLHNHQVTCFHFAMFLFLNFYLNQKKQELILLPFQHWCSFLESKPKKQKRIVPSKTNGEKEKTIANSMPEKQKVRKSQWQIQWQMGERDEKANDKINDRWTKRTKKPMTKSMTDGRKGRKSQWAFQW